ncbi:MAG: phospholipase [Planctomycetes bacterium]|nr:phospholipase [Planctomycetota bacterium]
MSERRTIEVARTARYHVLGAGQVHAREAWFLLHGYGQLAGPFLDSLTALARPERLLVAPEALARFYLRRGTGEIGASWMTKEERASEIHDNVRYLERVAQQLCAEHGAPLELQAFGFSQGGATAARWALLGSTPLTRVTLWGCPFPPDLELEPQRERARSTRWTFVLGDGDTAIDRAAWEQGLGRLRATGCQPEVRRFPGGHELDAATLRDLSGPG